MPNLTELSSDQEMIWKVRVCNRPPKQKNTVLFQTLIFLKQGHTLFERVFPVRKVYFGKIWIIILRNTFLSG